MKLGTRGSQLALWQAQTVAAAIATATGIVCEIVVIRTSGDERGTGLGPGGATLPTAEPTDAGARTAPASMPPSAPPANVKRLFVKEIEEALLDGRIDLAVHSSKDMPSVLPDGLTIAATLAREDPRDAVLLPHGAAAPLHAADLAARLGAGSRIGTSSIRRVAQLRGVLPAATFLEVRGNLDTRLRKLDGGAYDAIVLAAAGVKRLGHAARLSWVVPVEEAVPAPGQGIVAVEAVRERRDVLALLEAITDRAAFDALTAERAVVRTLGGGCQLPIGALAEIDGDHLRLTGAVIAPDGTRTIRHSSRAARADADGLGVTVGDALLRGGAAAILDALRLPPTVDHP